MTQRWGGWHWHLGLASWLAMGGVIAAFGNCALAQITPDNTLGGENSTVTSAGSVNSINGGATRGSNLFHSFEQFSVLTGREAHFNNALDIQNIISRVTGGLASNIDGLIRANGTANLFLLNPNGIIFGSNASLDIGGSFLASTANSLNFTDGTNFSATVPQSTPLLTVSVPLGLQFGRTAGGIRVQASSLDVPPGKTLALVGGDVALEGGSLTAAGTLTATGGRIELGSVAGASLVSLTPVDKGWRLGYEGIQNFQDIQLSQAAYVNASGAGGGDIQVQGRRVILTEGAGMEAITLGSQPGGTLAVKASESVALIGTSADNEFYSSLLTGVNFTATGTGGNLTIETGQLIVRDGAQVLTSTSGSGNAGELSVRASSVELVGTSNNGVSSGLFAGVNSFIARGAGGNLNLETGQLIVRNGAQVSASTLGRGNAGNLTVRASSVELVGTSEKGSPSGLFTTAGERATGNGGNLTVETGQLLVRDGAQVAVTTSGAGNAGNLTVGASEVTLIGTAPGIVTDSGLPIISGLFAGTEPGTKGDGGNLTIDTSRLIVQDGAEAQTSTLGEGDAGNLIVTASESVELIGRTPDNLFPSGLLAVSGLEGVFTEAQGKGGDLSIETGQLIVRDGAVVSVSSVGTGAAGDLAVSAGSFVLISGSNTYLSNGTTSAGTGGNITINTRRLLLNQGAFVSTESSSVNQVGQVTPETGAGGNLIVNASESVELNNGSLSSSTHGLGNAGNITINTGKLLLSNGGQVFSSTYDSGAAGAVYINARDSVEVSGHESGLFSRTGSTGDAGALNITAEELTIQNLAQVSVDNFIPRGFRLDNLRDERGNPILDERRNPITIVVPIIEPRIGSGNAGNLEITASSIRLEGRASITANSFDGNGGNIVFQVQDLLLLDSNSNISSTAGTLESPGNGGNITINTNNLVALQNSDITANAFRGQGGQIKIDAQGVFGTEFRNQPTPETSDITASSDLGPEFSGIVEINTPDVDPRRGLVNLPAELVQVSGLIATGCSAVGENKFIVTGRGGLPENPTDPLFSDAIEVNLVTLNPREENSSSPKVSMHPTNPAPAPLVEAQGWVINNKGEVVLTAHAPTDTSYVPWLNQPPCNES